MAIWDEYLSERDREHMAMGWAKKEPFGFGERPVLLIIDDYYGAVGDKPLPMLESIKTWHMSCGIEGWEAIYRTQDLLRSARSNGVPVVHCTGLKDFPHLWGSRRRKELPEELRDMQYQIVEEVAPQPGELVVYKAAPSGFFGTLLTAHLIHLGVDTIIACGESTSGCVRATVVDGATYRYRMGVVEECTFDRTQASHAMSLFDMHHKYADVIKLAEAISYFERTGGGN